MAIEQEICELIEGQNTEAYNLILILHDIQDKYGYVPREASLLLSTELSIPLAQIYEVLTFYHYFKTKPPAKHEIIVCNGTSCYLDGSEDILSKFCNELKIKPEVNSKDSRYNISTVRCIGCCSLGPLAILDGKIQGHIELENIPMLIASLEKGVTDEH